MRGLNSYELEVLRDARSTACDCDAPHDAEETYPPELAQAFIVLEERGLIVPYPCPSDAGAQHPKITAAGLDVLAVVESLPKTG